MARISLHRIARRRPNHALTLALLAGLAGCSDLKEPVAPSATTALQVAAPADDRIPDEYIVVLKPTVADPRGKSRALAARERATLRQTYSRAVRGFSARMSSAAAARLARDPDVAYVEPNVIVRGAGEVTQPSATWSLDRIDSRPRRFDEQYSYTSEGEGVRVYVIDTGINLIHPEFVVWDSPVFPTRPLETLQHPLPENDLSNPGACRWNRDRDLNGHGTHVAGIIGSRTFGVAKRATLISVVVLTECFNGSLETLLAGMDATIAHHVARSGPAVVNMSLEAAGVQQSVFDAVQAMEAAGITVVVAAGNKGTDACNVSPAGAPAAITVGATDRGDSEMIWSNFGRCVALVAPGVDVLSVNRGMSFDIVFDENGNFVSRTPIVLPPYTSTGTSQAAPHVAGAAARYLSVNPTATPAQVRKALLDGATGGILRMQKRAGPSTKNLFLYVNPRQ